MTEKDMIKLTNMIVDEISKRQAEIDNEFFEKMGNKGIEPFYVHDVVNKVSQRDIYIEKIKDLQSELLLQLAKENYEIADTLKKTIDELKRRLNEEL